jgi:hypothetical protein
MNERETNPYPQYQQADEHKAFQKGYAAYRHNLEVDAEEEGLQHPVCEDCTHRTKQQYTLKVAFRIEDVAGERSLTPKELAFQLSEILPREWWQDSNVAEWGTIEIVPLTKEGNPFVF